MCVARQVEEALDGEALFQAGNHRLARFDGVDEPPYDAGHGGHSSVLSRRGRRQLDDLGLPRPRYRLRGETGDVVARDVLQEERALVAVNLDAMAGATRQIGGRRDGNVGP